MATINQRAIDDRPERAAVFRAFARETLDYDIRNELFTLARSYDVLAGALLT